VKLQKTLLGGVPDAATSVTYSWDEAFQCCHQASLKEDQILHLTFCVPSQSFWTVWHENISEICDSLKEKTEEKIDQSRTPDDQVQIISLKATPEILALYNALPVEKTEKFDHPDKSRWIFIKSYQKSSLIKGSSDFQQPNPHAKYYKELATALEMKNIKKIDTLLKENKPLKDYKDDKGNSFMHLLAETSLTGYVHQFLSLGFQLLDRNHFGDIPLHYACNIENSIRDPQAQMVGTLIGVGSLFDIPNKQNQTPLMVAAKSGHVEAVKLLLKAGADINLRDQNGQTAIQLAQASGLPAASTIVKLLTPSTSCLIQ